MSEAAISIPATPALPDGLAGVATDWASDQRAFKNVSWGKAMMWIFLLSDTFIFGSFSSVLHDPARMSTRVPLAQSERGLRPEYRRQRSTAHPDRHHDLRADLQQWHHGHGGQLRLPARPQEDGDLDADDGVMLGATFVGMQAFEWTKLIMEGVRPWTIPGVWRSSAQASS